MRRQAGFIDIILLRGENTLTPKDPTTVRIEYEGAFDHALERGGHRGLIIKDDKGRKPSVSILREK